MPALQPTDRRHSNVFQQCLASWSRVWLRTQVHSRGARCRHCSAPIRLRHNITMTGQEVPAAAAGHAAIAKGTTNCTCPECVAASFSGVETKLAPSSLTQEPEPWCAHACRATSSSLSFTLTMVRCTQLMNTCLQHCPLHAPAALWHANLLEHRSCHHHQRAGASELPLTLCSIAGCSARACGARQFWNRAVRRH